MVGLSSFLLLAGGKRVLVPDAMSGLALIWTVASLFGIGLGTPTEQLIVRRMNVGRFNAAAVPGRLLAGSGVLAALACFGLAPRSGSAAALPLLAAGMALAVAGWVPCTVVRGRLAGAGDLAGYTGALIVESSTRILLVILAVLFPVSGSVLLPLAVGLPLLLAAAVASLLRVTGPLTAESKQGRHPGDSASGESGGRGGGPGARLEQVGFVLVSLGFQVCLNGAPIFLEWRVGHEVVGDFVIASTYFRIPSLLVAGVLTHALVDLSHGWGERDLDRFRRTRRTGLLQVLVLGAFGSAGLAVVSPVALRLYAGTSLALSGAVFVALPLSTAVAVVASMAGQPVLAAGRTPSAGLSWVAGAAVTTAFLLSADGVGPVIGTGLVAGPLVALALLLTANRGLGKAPVPAVTGPDQHRDVQYPQRQQDRPQVTG